MNSILLNNRWAKGVGYVLVTVFLGAIGSGLWEKILSRWLESASISVMNLLSSIFKGYSDVLYHSVGTAATDIFMVGPYVFFRFSILILLWAAAGAAFYRLFYQDKRKEARDVQKKSRNPKRLFWGMMVPACIVSTILGIHLFVQDVYTREVCVYIERSIDILAPKLSNIEVLELRAMYRSVDNAKKFYTLYDKLSYYATERKVELPKIVLVR